MRIRVAKVIVVFLVLASIRPIGARASETPVARPKKVLVELFSSQGCSSCPPASDLLGELTDRGHDSDGIVPLNFHVDYFNQPWHDPFSDPLYTRRQRDYNRVLRRDDLLYTPLMMVDGHDPLVGSDRAKAVAAIEKSLKSIPEIDLELELAGTANRKKLTVKVAARSRESAGRALLLGMALTEDSVTTRVLQGENAGRTLVEHHVVRRLEHKFVGLEPTGSQIHTFDVELPATKEGSRFHVTIFAQDRDNGKVYQADSIPWNPRKPTRLSEARLRDLNRAVALRKARRAELKRFTILTFDLSTTSTDDSGSNTLTTCPACGSPFNPPPPSSNRRRPGQGFAAPPVVTC